MEKQKKKKKEHTQLQGPLEGTKKHKKDRNTYPTAGTSTRDKRASTTARRIGKDRRAYPAAGTSTRNRKPNRREDRKREKSIPSCREREKPDKQCGKKANSDGCEKVRHMSTTVCRSERPDGRMHSGAWWSALLCLILHWTWQEVEQNEQLTQESPKVDRLYNGSEGDRGNVMYSVMDTEGSVDMNETGAILLLYGSLVAVTVS